MKEILIINGPNLNLLGNREKNSYGDTSLEKIQSLCENHSNKNEYYIITKDFKFAKNNLNKCELKFATIPKLLFKLNSNWQRLKPNGEIFYFGFNNSQCFNTINFIKFKVYI